MFSPEVVSDSLRILENICVNSSYGPCGISGKAWLSDRWFGIKGRRSFGSSDMLVRGLLLTIDFVSGNTVAISFHERICSPTVTCKARFINLIYEAFVHSSLVRT